VVKNEWRGRGRRVEKRQATVMADWKTRLSGKRDALTMDGFSITDIRSN